MRRAEVEGPILRQSRAVRLAVRVLVVALVLVGIGAVPAAASEEIERVRLIPEDGGSVVIDERIYEGPVDVESYQSGLGVVEVIPMDQYLLGIREVPFGWPEEALRTQVVAARTYAAWTLAGGRSETGAKYGYDICATSRCQVYKGTADLDTALGARWKAAVQDTSGQILVARGAPAQALYSSSFGSTSLGNQSVWGGDPVSYLQPVSSPEVGIAPFAEWTVVVPIDSFLEMLRRGGFDVGSQLEAVRMDDGEGRDPAELVVNTADGVTRVPATRVRSTFNRWGPRLYPSSFPVVTPKGNRYPQTILSYAFDVEMRPAPLLFRPGFVRVADVPVGGSVVISGEGWGHGVGLSQWGARIMADQGAAYTEILGHYYGGLQPTQAGELIPTVVRVGLVAGRPVVGIEIVGPVALEVNGIPAGSMASGTWLLHADGDEVLRASPVSARVVSELLRRPWPR